jgi:hypothetical protein
MNDKKKESVVVLEVWREKVIGDSPQEASY